MPNTLTPQRRVWTQHPPFQQRYDLSNPLVQGLIFGWDAAVPTRDQVSGLTSTISAGNVAGVGPHGVHRSFSGSQAGGSFSFGNFSGLTGKTSATWDVLFYLSNVSQDAKLFSQWNNNHQNWLIQTSATSLIWIPCDDASGLRTRFDLSGAFPAAGWYRIILSWQGGVNKRVIVNGIDKTPSVSTVSSGALVGATTIDPLQIGVAIDGQLNGSIVFCRVWDRGLTVEECKKLSVNPWQIFSKRDRYAFITVGAGSSLNAAASGSDTVSGSATLSAQVALAGVGVAVAGGAAVGSVAVPLSAAGISVTGGSANGTATVRISAAGLAQAAGQAGLSASVLLAAADAAQAAGNATLAAQLGALASGAALAGGSANLTGGAPGALSASGGIIASGSAVLSISVQLQATGAAQASGSASGTASAPGQIDASGGAQSGGAATVSVAVQLTAAGFVQAMGSGQFSANIPLSAFGHAVASGHATMAISDGSVSIAPGPARYRVTAAPRLRRVYEQRNYVVKK